MPRTYKGYELMKEIAEDKIKDGTKFKIENYDKTLEGTFDGCEIYINEEETLDDIWSLYAVVTSNFIVIENEEEIDIQEIEEYEFPSYADKLTPIESKLLELINENRKAIKQLDRKIKKKKG